MTAAGLLHLGSMIYLSGIICLTVSVNENHDPKLILRETLRRWAKFLGVSLVLVVLVFSLSR